MSEPSSLYAKIHITKENLEKFMNSFPTQPPRYKDWQSWFNTKKMYGDGIIDEKELQQMNFPSTAIVKKIIEETQSDELPGFTPSEYDEEKGIWHLLIPFFRENYFEMIPILSLLRGVQQFKEKNEEDFIIVYSHFWDSGVDAYIKFALSESLFVEEVNEIDLQLAMDYVTNKFKNNNFNVDDV